MTYRLIGPDNQEYFSKTPGKFGGYKPRKIYGQLDCPSALRWLKKGQYKQHRVFFATEADAIAAGYRACEICMRSKDDR